MRLDAYIDRIRKKLPKSWLLFAETMGYWRRLCRHNASFSTDRDIRKMQYTLLRENHVIEKGMSMKNPKKGFGQQKVTALIARMSLYFDLHGQQDSGFMLYPLSTINHYVQYMKEDGVAIPAIETAFQQLCSKVGITEDQLDKPAGVFMEKGSKIQEEAKGDFRSLLFSRHSVRYFKDELPAKQQLIEALELAARTPSACNRQAWHTHVYMGEQSHELLDMQGGCGGFAHDVHCSIVVTADMNGFLDYEPFQCYVDGGLYAMNLINALHYVGLGTIPLSCGFYHRKLSAIQQRFDIPENEAMVVIIGVGVLEDEMKVAESTRRPIEKTNVFHE